MARSPHAGRIRRPAVVRPVGALSALVLAAASLGVVAPGAFAGDAGGARVDLPTMPSHPTVVAASGGSVVLDVGASTPNYWVTSDDGGTYARLTGRGLTVGEVAGARDGKLVTDVPGDGPGGDETRVYVQDLATGAVADPVTVPAPYVHAVDTDTAIYLDAGTFHAEDLASGTSTPLAYTPATGSADVVARLGGGDEALLAQLTVDSSGRPSTGFIDLVPLDGSASTLPRLVVPGLSAVGVRGEQVVYSTATPATNFNPGQALCFVAADSWQAPDCVFTAVAGLGDQRLSLHELTVGDDWVQWTVTAADGAQHYVVDGTDAPGTLTAVDMSGDTSLATVGDPDRPVARVPDADPGYIGSVATDGSISRRFDFPQAPVAEEALELTPDRVVGLDSRPASDSGTFQAWQRAVSDDGLDAEEQPLPRALDLGTSGARTLLDDGTTLRLFDRDRAVRTLPLSKYGSLPGLISGPYFPAYSLSYVQALDVTGKVRKSATIRGLFGSLVLVRTSAPLGRYDVVDVAGGGSWRVNVPLTYRRQGFDLAGLWGDWAFGYTFTPSLVPYTLAFNYRTGEHYSRYGLPVAYGDGFVAVKYADTNADGDDVIGLEVWNPATGQAETVPDTDWDQVATDGTARLAYSTATELVLRDLTVVPVGRARLLGALAPSSLNLITHDRSWSLELDTTKPLQAGTLTITDADGAVVRTFPTDASVDGSLRGLEWDGRDENGDDVPLGTYTWKLVAAAADGSGHVVGIDGVADFGDRLDAADPTDDTDGVAGTVEVVRKLLGTIGGATPVVSGTPKVGRTLTAKPGTWTPSGVSLAYKWYKVSSSGRATALSGSTNTYVVRSTDVRYRIKVQVVGTKEGWATTTRTSKLTATVVRG